MKRKSQLGRFQVELDVEADFSKSKLGFRASRVYEFGGNFAQKAGQKFCPPNPVVRVAWIPLPVTVVNGRGMTSSVGAASAALSGRGIRKDDDSTDYQIILPALPTGTAVLNTVFLHADVRGHPYRVEDFRDALNRLALLPEVVALGAYQMNHVWALTLKSPEGKRKTLAAGDLVVKRRRCIVVDPGDQAVCIKLHWLLHHIPDDEVREALGPYGKVTEVVAEKWRVQCFLGCGSMTRTAVIRLKPGLAL